MVRITLLAGARLQLRKDTGEGIPRMDDPGKMVARNSMDWEPGTYVIHELQAPAGYAAAGGPEAVVIENNDTTQVFQYETAKSSSEAVEAVETSQNLRWTIFHSRR